MQSIAVFVAILAVASAASLQYQVVPSTSAVVTSQRLGGNFAYTVQQPAVGYTGYTGYPGYQYVHPTTVGATQVVKTGVPAVAAPVTYTVPQTYKTVAGVPVVNAYTNAGVPVVNAYGYTGYNGIYNGLNAYNGVYNGLNAYNGLYNGLPVVGQQVVV